MASSESKKRKREDDPPRVTFNTPNRTFERLLKESSLESLRAAVVRKLDLDGAALLEFSQVRDGKQIDLEDEDDFEAFESYAASNGVAEVRVKILNSSSLPEQGTDSRQAPPGPLASLGPPFEISQLAHPNLGIMSPVSQVNEHGSTLKDISSTSLDRAVPSKPKPKRVPKSKTVSDGPATVKPSVDDALNGKEASAPGKKKVVRSRKADQGAGAEAEKINNGIVEPEEASHDDRSAHPQEEQGLPATAAPKKSKTRGSAVQTSNAADTSSSMPTIPSISPTALPTTSSPEAPPVDPKTKDSKGQGTSKTTDQPTESPRSSPTSEKVENKKQTDKERKATQGVNEAAVTGAPKGRKRALGPRDGPADASTMTENKSKKRKPVGNDAMMKSSDDRDATSTTAQAAPPKSSKAKKKTKPTEEERAQYDAHIDSVIADIVAKRVSASSRQTAASAPVTTPASSGSKKELSKELPVVGAEESTTVEPKRRKKPGKQKDTEISIASDGNAAGDNPPERKTSPDINGEKLKAVRESDKRLGSPQDITEPTGILQANRKTAIAVQRVAQEISQQQGNSQPKTSGIQSFAPSGSDISEMIGRHEGESTSSDSNDSISGFSDNSEVGGDDTVTVSGTQKDQKGAFNSKALLDTTGILDSFAIDDVASLDVDALLNPKSNLSWRDVLSTVQDDDRDGPEQLMSDVDEEEEGETEIRSPRNSLPRRRSPSPSYDEDDDNDSTPEDHRDIAPTEGPKMASSRESPTISRDSEESAGIQAGREEEDAHVTSQLPFLKDVSTRGESVARGGSVDLIVQQAMEEDDTLYLTGLSQVPGKLRGPQKAHPERIDASSQDSVAEVDRHGVHDNALQSSKDKNSSPSSAKTPGADFTSSFRIHEARSTSGSPRLLRGRIERMRGRNVRVADAEQTSGPDTSQNKLNLPFDDPDISQLVATSTPVDERRQHNALHRSVLTASDQSEGANKAGLSLSQPLARRNVRIPSTTPKRTAKLGHKAKDASQVSSSRKETQETLKATESSAEKTQDERSTTSQETPRDRLGVEAPMDRDTSSACFRNGSTTQPTQSVDDLNKTKNKAIAPPYTQLGRDSASPEHRLSSDSSETEDSESGDEDLDQDSPPAAQAASTTQASHVADRSLTNIVNRRDLFSRTSTPRPSFAMDASSQMGLENADGDNDSDSSSSSSSDSDRDSHIPEEKRAGHTASQSKASQLFKTIFHFP